MKKEVDTGVHTVHTGATLRGSQPSAHWCVTGSQRQAMNMMGLSISITTLIITSTFPCLQEE